MHFAQPAAPLAAPDTANLRRDFQVSSNQRAACYVRINHDPWIIYAPQLPRKEQLHGASKMGDRFFMRRLVLLRKFQLVLRLLLGLISLQVTSAREGFYLI